MLARAADPGTGLLDPPHHGVVYLEHFAGGSYLKKKAEVDTAVDRWHRLDAHALGSIDSAELLRRLRGAVRAS